jgi:hypothetical protein
MTTNKPFTFQLMVIGGFIFFFYMFFALAMSIYRDYKLESEIDKFQQDINQLAQYARQKPEDVQYFASEQYKDRYAKENLNLLNPGERLIIIPEDQKVVEQGPAVLEDDKFDPSSIINKGNPTQWKEYFFGKTLSLKVPSKPITTPIESLIKDLMKKPDEEKKG